VSSWGHQNFEDDDALDYVDSLKHKISQELDRAAAKRRLSGDEVLSRCIPRLAVLALLVKGSNSLGPPADQLGRWQTAFLAAYDRDSAAIFDEPADARRRRKVIQRTFADLSDRALTIE
jgi:hypothetical protein